MDASERKLILDLIKEVRELVQRMDSTVCHVRDIEMDYNRLRWGLRDQHERITRLEKDHGYEPHSDESSKYYSALSKLPERSHRD